MSDKALLRYFTSQRSALVLGIVVSFLVPGFIIWFAQQIPEDFIPAASFIGIAFTIIAIYACWKLNRTFDSEDGRDIDSAISFLEVESTVDRTSLGAQLITYRKQLRTVALSYERQRQNLTRAALLIAILFLIMPVATWLKISAVAFAGKNVPNAWLLIVSSSTAGAVGLAVVVTVLRHVKNSQRPLTEIQERLFDALEAGIAINASEVPPELQKLAMLKVLTTLSVLRARQIAQTKEEPDADEMNVAIDIVKSAMKPPSGG